MRITLRPLLLVCAAAALLAQTALAQLEPPATGGVVALDQELRMLGHYQRVLMIGAHPDDEDTELLTVLVRGRGVEAAYLALNRGEGGQNLIGSELGEGLGLLRSGELLAARRLDGAGQFFTRAFDFGYSKTLEDTWQHWPRDSVLKDVVRVIRQFRPQVIVSIFSGTPRDGHGQHQAAGWAANEAFRIAGDPTRFPDAGPAWTPLKLFRSTRFDAAATTLTLNGGELDPVVGRSFRQIAMQGRSLHRSQDMGMLQPIGPSSVRLRLVEDRTGAGGEAIFAGIDTTLAGMARAVGLGGAAAWPSIEARLDSLRRAGHPADFARIYAALERLRADLVRAAGAGLESREFRDQRRHFDRALAIASGLVVDAIADDERVAPGQSLGIEVSVWNTTDRPARVRAALVGREGWEAPVAADTVVEVAPGALVTWTAGMRARSDAAPSEPYFLRQPRDGDMYRWPGDASVDGLPFGPPELELAWGRDDGHGGMAFVDRREVSYRTTNQAFGEVRRPVFIVPRVDVQLDPSTEIWPLGSSAAHTFQVTLSNGTRDTALAGEVRLTVPRGWPPVAPQPFRFTAEDQRLVFDFPVRPPEGLAPGAYDIRAVARDGSGRTYGQGVRLVDYPHIHPRQHVEPALATVHAAPLALPALARVGYVRGAADRVPEALRGIGVPIQLLDHEALQSGDLSRYDAIVIGPRAYETDSVLVASNDRLLDYVRRGGLLIVQYQQFQFFYGGYAPSPLAVGDQPLPSATAVAPAGSSGSPRFNRHDRVTDENAPVTPLDPNAPVLRAPNRIGPDDWEGWVQERGLYFASAWDDAYRPQLAMHDPGEPPLEGSLLIAREGQGTYVYTALSFFRQLPAGVPGAFRLFANLLALSAATLP